MFGEVLRLKGAIESGEKALAGYKKELGELSVAEREVARQAGIVDSFKARQRAVEEATKAFHEAQAEVRRLAEQAESAPSAATAHEIVTKIGPASKQVSTAASRLAAEKEAYQQEVIALKSIGVEIHEIEEAERRLEQTAILASKARITQNENERISLVNLAVQAQERARATEAQVIAQRASAGVTAAPGGTSAVRAALDNMESGSSRDGALRGRSVDQGIEDLEKVAKRGAAIGSVYSRQLELMHAVQIRIAADVSLIESFERQAKAVTEAEKAYRDADAALRVMISSTASGVTTARELAEAEAKLGATGANLTKQLSTQQAIDAELRKQKIDTADLAGETDKLVAKVERLATASKKIEKGSKLFGLEPYQLKNLEYQIGDVYTQLSLGQGVMRTFESQADQIFQIFDFSILQFKMMLLYGAPAIAVIYTFVSAMISVKAQVDELRRVNSQLLANVDGASTTAKKMLEAEKSVQHLGASFEEAGKAIEIFYRAGIAPERLKDFGKLAQDLVEVYGEKLPEAAKKITEGFTHGYEGIKKLDEQYNFLSVAERERIRNLIEQGNLQEALNLAFGIFKTRQDEAADASRTRWSDAVLKLKTAWDDLLTTFGRTNTLSAIAEAMKVLVDLMTTMTRLASGEISPGNFVRRIVALDRGTQVSGPQEEKLRDLEGKRADIQQRIVGYERAKELNPSAVNPASTERYEILKTQAVELDAEIARLRVSANTEKLSAELEDLRKKRRELGRLGEVETSGEAARAPTTSMPGVPDSYTQMRDRVADTVGLDREALARVQRVEGVYENGDWKASRTGVRGAMQVTQATLNELRQRYPDIGRDRNDPESSTLAGAYYLREKLKESGGDLAQAYGRYNGVPGETLSGNAAIRNGVSINGYTGNALSTAGQSAGAIDRRIAELERQLGVARLGGVTPSDSAATGIMAERERATAAATPGRVIDTGAKAQQKRADDFVDELDRAEGLRRRNRELRGEAAIRQDAERLYEFEKDLRGKAGKENVDLASARAQLPSPAAPTAQDRIDFRSNPEMAILNAVDREKERLADQRSKKEQAEREKDKAAEEALANALNSIRAKIDNKDKTNIEARRRAVDEEYAKFDETIRKARERNVPDVGGVPIDRFVEMIKAAKEAAKDQVTTEGREAILNDIVKERSAVYKKISDDLKSGAITLQIAFERGAEAAAKFAPRIAAARTEANAALVRQGGANPSQAIQTAITRNNSITDFDKEETKGLLDTGFTQLSEYQKTRREIVATQKELVADGLETTAQGEAKVKAAYDKTQEAVEKLIASLRERLELEKKTGTITDSDYVKRDADLLRASADAKYVSPFDKKLDKTIEDSSVSHAVQGLDLIAQAAGRVAAGQGKIGDIFVSLGQASANFAAGVLKDVAQMIIKFELLAVAQSLMGKSDSVTPSAPSGGSDAGSIFARLFKMGASYFSGGATNLLSSGGGGDPFGGAGVSSTAFSHNGSIVGSSTQSRAVDSRVFDFARRYHNGGTVGLSHDEVPTILQLGEEVITRSDARHVMNGGKKANSETVTQRPVRNVLVLDPRDLSSALTGSHGEDVVMHHIKSNSDKVNSLLGR